MTDREKTIVTAYTGVTMLQGEKLDLLYDYVSKLIGRPVQTLELVFLADKIQELSKPDFIKLCAEDTERRGKWLPGDCWSRGIGMGEEYGQYRICSLCGYQEPEKRKYCAGCGARMEGMEDVE